MHMFSRLYRFLFITLTIVHSLSAQDIESLKAQLPDNEGESKVNLLHTLSRNIRWTSPEEALRYAKESLEISESLEDVRLIAISYRYIGSAHYYLGNYKDSFLFSERSLNLARSIGDSSLMITNLNGLGIDSYDLGSLENSMQYFLEAVELMEANGGKLKRAIVLNNMGLLFERIGKFEEARNYSVLGLQIAKANNNRNVQIYSHNGIGISYLKQGQFDLALLHLDSAQRIAQELDNRVWGSVAHNYMGEVFRNLKNYDLAHHHFNTALELSQSIGDRKRMADVYSNSAKLCLEDGHIDKTMEFLDKSQELAAANNWRHLYLTNLKLYADVYDNFQMGPEMISSQADYIIYRDSTYDEIMARNLELVPLKLSEQRDRIRLSNQEAALKEQKFANKVYLVVIIIAIPIVGLLLYLFYTNKKQNRILEAKNAKIRQTQDLLIKSEKMASLGIMASGIGHEINNPLNYIENGVRNISNLIHKKYNGETPEELNRFVDIVNEGVSRASVIVNSLANFSRVGIEKDEQCDLPTILENCLAILSSEAKNIEIKKNYHSETLTVAGNESKLHQVCMNLLTNAIHAVSGNEYPSIEINITQSGKRVVLTIRDNGYGIPKENLSKIMDPFFTTKDPGKGTGLGLFISHSFIDEHNGTLEVNSKKEEGTEFKVTLPIFE